MTALAEPAVTGWELTEPGVYNDIPEDVYHSDPVPGGSLTASSAKDLLPPSCPAVFRHKRDNPKPPTPAMEQGTAAHTLILGTGAQPVEVEADSWRAKDTREQGDQIRAEGGVPLLTKDYVRVHAMAAAIADHAEAAALLDPGSGDPEQTLIARDPWTYVTLRGRADWLRHDSLVDYKTTTNVSLHALSKTVEDYKWQLQAAWYRRMSVLAGWFDEMPPFRFICQEKEAPYLVRVIELDDEALMVGDALMRKAIDTYVECATADYWPAHPQQIETIGLPGWASHRYMSALDAGDLPAHP